MKRRTIVLPIIALALSAATAFAQSAPPAGGGMGGQGMGMRQGGPNRRMQRLLQGITLTETQQAQVDSINAAFDARRPAFTPGQRPDSATMAQFRELNQQRDAAIRAVLTPEQQQVFDQNVASMPAFGRRPQN